MCITFALIHLFIWFRQRGVIAHLLFSIAALGAAGCAFAEFWALTAGTIETYHSTVRWQHIPVFILLVSLVWFIVVYFGTARKWLAQLITALWVLVLVINFLSPHSIVFTDISYLKYVELPWGEQFSIAIGTNSPWKIIPDMASLLIILFLADASIQLWKRGDRRRAITIGGSSVFFILAGGIHSPLVDAGIVHTPYLISFAFLGIILAMGFELSNDVVRAALLLKEVKANERRWRSLLENVQLLVVGLDIFGKVNYVNPYFLKLTGFDKEEVQGKNWFEYFLPESAGGELKRLFYETLESEFYPHYQDPVITRNGEERLIDWSNVKLYDREGNIIGTLSIGADITEREEAFQEIK
ncbi:MAG: hypothetical protein AMJ61_00005, partial [Desulfobacterales bacterium SG8_35_2]